MDLTKQVVPNMLQVPGKELIAWIVVTSHQGRCPLGLRNPVRVVSLAHIDCIGRECQPLAGALPLSSSEVCEQPQKHMVHQGPKTTQAVSWPILATIAGRKRAMLPFAPHSLPKASGGQQA